MFLGFFKGSLTGGSGLIRALIGAESALEYGIQDLGGQQPPSHRAFFGEPTSYGDAVVE